jgi:anti-anti-sigma factor
VDIAVVPDIQVELARLIEANLVNLVLDLADVQYADSSALGLLVWIDNELDTTDGKVVLVGADRNVTRVLEMSGLVSVAESICVDDSVSSALGGLDVAPTDDEPEWTDEFQIEADTAALARARDRVESLVQEAGFAESALFDIKVALGEALSNAVRHGSGGNGDGSIDVRVSSYRDCIVIDIEDAGAGFDGVHACSDDLYASGGRGIMFMRALMDRVVFSPAPGGGTIVTLVKHRAGAGQTG